MPKTTRPQRYTQDSRVVFRVLLALERLADLQAKHTEILTRQEHQLSELRKYVEVQTLLDSKVSQFESTRERKKVIKNQWNIEILKWDPLPEWPPDDNRSLRSVLSDEAPWNISQYRLAYPATAKFLDEAEPKEKSHSQVYYDAFFSTGEVVDRWNSEASYAMNRGIRRQMPQKFWNLVKSRIVTGEFDEPSRIPSRVLRILDMSPTVAAILLESTPKYVTLPQTC